MFSTAYLPHIGGAELALKEITDRIKNVDFDLITTSLGATLKEERIGNVNIFRVGPKLLYPLSACLKARTLSRNNEYSSIFALQASYGGGGSWLFKLFNPKVPFILNIQEGKDLHSQGFFINFFRKLIIKKADIIIAISKFLSDYAGAINKKAKIGIIPNGVDLNKFKPNFSENGKTIITASRLVPKNGVEDLVEAIYHVKEKVPDIKLLIIGIGPLEERLKSKAKDLKDTVIFLGKISPDELPEYLAQADIFVRPSRSEGLGTAFLEAMASGLPIIGTPVGGIPDFLTDGETGIFCKPSNSKDLADKILKLIADKPLRQKLSENGRRLVEQKYNWDNIAEEYQKLFISV